eukprot:771477-Pyramimonas_sp.AAC.1
MRIIGNAPQQCPPSAFCRRLLPPHPGLNADPLWTPSGPPLDPLLTPSTYRGYVRLPLFAAAFHLRIRA